MAEVQLPSESERKAFVEKLAQFRSTLSPNEQRMLDAMAIAAFGTQEPQSDVQGYGWFYGPYGPVYTGPTFYQTGWTWQWQATPWGYVYRTVPTGVWYP
ncbi:MAG: hypothetical protein IRZ14_12155 [Chloroflexi bacterium]|jgi:hypothetical protein|nr:hypothetical protein [Chloroflexota bacterium]